MAKESQYDAIERKNVANILEKLKSGKTLTAADKKALENHRRKEEGLRPQMTESELADELGVDRITIRRWKAQGAPFDGSNKDLYDWMAANNIRGAVKWRKAYREANPDQFPSKKKTARKALSKEPEPESKSAEILRDEYLADLQSAKASGDEFREKMALNAYLKIDKQIRESEAHNKKLGIDRGEMLSRGEVERILCAVAWSGNACCDKFSKQIAQRISEKKPAEVYAILAPTLTALSLFEGMKRVTKSPGEINLPEWVVECFATEEKQYLK
jgi:transposase-like protein